ncbi:RES family NAD+ phosphorylase [Priestia megaterium]|uniref:RES family NAD+ phosphorylase n=2 Tax=Priestia TaxID=2800373 RepID=UPI0025AFDBCE|nr:RES family NAD+ phosphorylase [Priestia megaterium]MDN3362218.1 RES family NAD+ phosphorylase [Priestia megaterium]
MKKTNVTGKNSNETKVDSINLITTEQKENDTTKLSNSLFPLQKLNHSPIETTKLSDSLFPLQKLNYSPIETTKLSDSLFPLQKLNYSPIETTKLSDSLFPLQKLNHSPIETTKLSDSLFPLQKLNHSPIETTKLSDSLFPLQKLNYSPIETTKLSDSLFPLQKLNHSPIETTKLSDSLFPLQKLNHSPIETTKLSDSLFPLQKLNHSHISTIISLQASLIKLPKTYRIEENKVIIDGKKNKRAIVKNTVNKDSVPLDSLASTLSPIDIINDLTADEIFSFYNHLIKYPLLGLNHDVGRKIFNEISDQKLITVSNIKLFRARERNSEEREMPFNELEMFEAPYGIAGHGRFNVKGQGELYTCENKDVALKEIGAINQVNKKYEIAEWKLIQEVRLLDLTNKDSELVKFCLFKKISHNAQEYILPNFLAQCAKYHNINGIKVSSTIDERYNNYIFFDFENRWFKLLELRYDIRGI